MPREDAGRRPCRWHGRARGRCWAPAAPRTAVQDVQGGSLVALRIAFLSTARINGALATGAREVPEVEVVAVASRDLGRAEARNTLAHLARGAVLLFLDADSLPDAPGFVARALEAAQDPSEVVCGGRTGQRCPPAPVDARLFERHSQKREWISAAERNRDPAASPARKSNDAGREHRARKPLIPGPVVL